MPTVHLSPIGNDTPFYSGGTQLNAGSLYTYLAGTTTLATTYTDEGALTTNSNPIVTNSEGYPSNGASRVQIWLTATLQYKFILKDADGVTLWSMDDISGINDINLTSSEWVSPPVGITPSYVNATTFTFVGDGVVSGDQTAEAVPNRWVKTVSGSGTGYGIIVSASYAAPITTVTVVMASGTLAAPLSLVQYGLLRPDHPSTPLDATNLKATANVTAAATTNIWTTSAGAGPVNGNIVHITGGTPITSLGTAQRAGQKRYVIFDSATTIAHNASTLILPGAATITTAVGDYMEVTADSTTKMIVAPYVRVNGQPVAPTVPRGTIDGLIVSRSAANTLTISAGQASNSGATSLMNLSSSITKSQSAWAVGTSVGGLLAGSIPNSAYPGGFVRVFMLYNPTTQVGDIGFQDSASGVTPDMTLPNAQGYTLYRWIFDWPIVVAGNGFDIGVQSGEEFWYTTIAQDLNQTLGTSATSYTIRVPPTVKFKCLYSSFVNQGINPGNAAFLRIYDPDNADVVLDGTALATASGVFVGATQGRIGGSGACWTDITQKIRAVCSGAASNFLFSTLGYVHQRGRNL